MPDKINNKDGLSEKRKKINSDNEKTGRQQGIANGFLLEPVPSYKQAPSETIYQGMNNSFIVLGRDRSTHEMSGLGAKGATQCGRIDLITGLGAGGKSIPDEDHLANPSFQYNAARVYISQKTHLDRYMGLAEVDDEYGEGFSGIGLKADTIRMHSRGDLKIVTGKGLFSNSGRHGEKFSNGEVNERIGKIYLIAGNDTKGKKISSLDMLRPFNKMRQSRNYLQPIPKGENLIECIGDLIHAMEKLSRIVGDNQQAISKLSRAVAMHTHIATAPGAPVIPSFGLVGNNIVQEVNGLVSKTDRIMLNKNFGLMKITYLNKTGSDYINSKHVYTN